MLLSSDSSGKPKMRAAIAVILTTISCLAVCVCVFSEPTDIALEALHVTGPMETQLKQKHEDSHTSDLQLRTKLQGLDKMSGAAAQLAQADVADCKKKLVMKLEKEDAVYIAAMSRLLSFHSTIQYKTKLKSDIVSAQQWYNKHLEGASTPMAVKVLKSQFRRKLKMLQRFSPYYQSVQGLRERSKWHAIYKQKVGSSCTYQQFKDEKAPAVPIGETPLHIQDHVQHTDLIGTVMEHKPTKSQWQCVKKVKATEGTIAQQLREQDTAYDNAYKALLK